MNVVNSTGRYQNTQYELYDLSNDSDEMNNLLPINAQATITSLEKQIAMQAELSSLLQKKEYY